MLAFWLERSSRLDSGQSAPPGWILVRALLQAGFWSECSSRLDSGQSAPPGWILVRVLLQAGFWSECSSRLDSGQSAPPGRSTVNHCFSQTLSGYSSRGGLMKTQILGIPSWSSG